MKHPLNEYINFEHYCVPLINPNTREIITKYSKLANDPKRKVRTISFGKEPESLSQGDNRTGAKVKKQFICTDPSRNQINTD